MTLQEAVKQAVAEFMLEDVSWNEEDHPRDKDGKFSSKDANHQRIQGIVSQYHKSKGWDEAGAEVKTVSPEFKAGEDHTAFSAGTAYHRVTTARGDEYNVSRYKKHVRKDYDAGNESFQSEEPKPMTPERARNIVARQKKEKKLHAAKKAAKEAFKWDANENPAWFGDKAPKFDDDDEDDDSPKTVKRVRKKK